MIIVYISLMSGHHDAGHRESWFGLFPNRVRCHPMKPTPWIDIEHLVICFPLTATFLWCWVCLTCKLYLLQQARRYSGWTKCCCCDKYQPKDCTRYICFWHIIFFFFKWDGTLIVLGTNEINILQDFFSWTPHQGPYIFDKETNTRGDLLWQVSYWSWFVR